jgi:asparagine synthase (glutamine-hydrolysing)
LEAAKKVAKLYKTDHHEYIMSSHEIFDSIDDIIESFDEPFGGVVSTFFISKLIKKHVKVALSGDGGDELFGSYLSHRLALPMKNYYDSGGQGSLDKNNYGLSDKDYQTFLSIKDKEMWKWRSKLSVFKEEEKGSLYSKSANKEMNKYNTDDLWKNYFLKKTANDPLNQILEAELKTIFPDQVLAFSDRLSMAHSIELRPPILDHRLVELAAAIPGDLKIKNGVTKYIFKKAARGLLPDEIINRPKEGFVLPINFWLIDSMKDFVINTLSADRLKAHNFFNEEVVKNLIKCYYSSTNCSDFKSFEFTENSNKLWLLLMFQLWWERYFS